VWTRVGPGNHVLDDGPDLHMRRGNFDGQKVICTGNGWLKQQDQQFFNNSIRALEKCLYCGHARLCVCLSAAVRSHYCMDLDVTWRHGRGCPLVVHYWADLQSGHGLRCYGNITRTLVLKIVRRIWEVGVAGSPYSRLQLLRYRLQTFPALVFPTQNYGISQGPEESNWDFFQANDNPAVEPRQVQTSSSGHQR